MTRRRHPRELRNSRIWQWKEGMKRHVITLPSGEKFDSRDKEALQNWIIGEAMRQAQNPDLLTKERIAALKLVQEYVATLPDGVEINPLVSNAKVFDNVTNIGDMEESLRLRKQAERRKARNE